MSFFFRISSNHQLRNYVLFDGKKSEATNPPDFPGSLWDGTPVLHGVTSYRPEISGPQRSTPSDLPMADGRPWSLMCATALRAPELRFEGSLQTVVWEWYGNGKRTWEVVGGSVEKSLMDELRLVLTCHWLRRYSQYMSYESYVSSACSKRLCTMRNGEVSQSWWWLVMVVSQNILKYHVYVSSLFLWWLWIPVHVWHFHALPAATAFFCCHGWIVPSVVRSPKSPEIRQADLTVSCRRWLELQSQPVFNGCFVKQPISYVKIWNHPIESSIYKWMFQVPGVYNSQFQRVFTLFLSFMKVFPPGPFMGSRIRHPALQDVVDELGGLRQEREEAARRAKRSQFISLATGRWWFQIFFPPQFGEHSHFD